MNDWNINNSKKTYNIENWGDGYFDINSAGNLCVIPDQKHTRIDLFKLSQNLQQSNLSFPILLRFLDIIKNKINRIENAFKTAMEDHNFSAEHMIAYPIKVNQQSDVIDEVISGADNTVGLEAGSKPELIAVLAKSKPGSLVICNGYKDAEYIKLALLGQKLGLKVYIVIEKLSEVALIARVASENNAVPLLGIRTRLATVGSGNWQNSGGENSKFGLSSSQVLKAISQLSSYDLLSSLKLLHFHLGSQIPNLSNIETGACEIARYFHEIRDLGADIDTIDVGGGLGIDYEGSKSTNYCSINYSVEQYANAIISPIATICEKNNLDHPNIICESGRAITAQHAILITNAVDIDQPAIRNNTFLDCSHSIIDEIKRELKLSISDIDESFLIANTTYKKIQSLFKQGEISLIIKSSAENLYHELCQKIMVAAKTSEQHQHIFNELSQKLADKLFCNLSIFQSMPDIWGIKQIFPIAPIHKLEQKPAYKAIIQDITCDSDGQIKDYVDSNGIERSLPVHEFKHGDQYYLGFFMVGAYQEILGDLHNLFGDTHSASIKLCDNGYNILDIKNGDSISDVLKTVNISPHEISSNILRLLDNQSNKSINTKDINKIINNALAEYTYLHPGN